MGKLERLAAARERVKKWKATHPKSVEWQRKRWYARRKGERKADSIEAAGRVIRQGKLKEYPHYGELHTGLIEGVDVGYGEMGPEGYGGQELAGISETHRRERRREGPSVWGDGPELDGAQSARAGKLTSGSTFGPKPLGDASGASLTLNEARTYAQLEGFKARRAQMEKGTGVQVDLIL